MYVLFTLRTTNYSLREYCGTVIAANIYPKGSEGKRTLTYLDFAQLVSQERVEAEATRHDEEGDGGRKAQHLKYVFEKRREEVQCECRC